MEYNYYRELKHNYLIARDCGIDKSNCDCYPVRIAKNGNFKGFVPCDIRVINNEYFLYYEINSLQSIKNRFASKGMRLEQLKKLFSSLKSALDGLSEYLLGMENIILDSESIFTDLATGDFYFLYCPFRAEGKGFASFIDELFDLVDHEDEAAVEMVYTCSEQAQNDGMLVFELISNMLEKSDDTKTEELTEEAKDSTDISDAVNTPDEDDMYEDYYVPKENRAKTRFMPKKDLSGKAQILFSFLFFALLASMVFIRMHFILSDEENILSIIVMLLSSITGIVAFLSGVKECMSGEGKKVREPEKKNESDEDGYYEEEYTDDFNDMGDLSSEDLRLKMSDVARDIPNEQDENIDVSIYKKPISVSSGLKSSDETIVLNMDEGEEKEYTLYSRNTEKTLRISLGKLPVTIGKLGGCVDNVINDKSISRIHCRFSQNEEGRIVLTDLNSTNGTFKNGLRLKPQESSFIEEGDEVRIGRICFDCR